MDQGELSQSRGFGRRIARRGGTGQELLTSHVVRQNRSPTSSTTYTSTETENRFPNLTRLKLLNIDNLYTSHPLERLLAPGETSYGRKFEEPSRQLHVRLQ